MARKLTVAAAQTGPVLGSMATGVEAACAMVQEAARKGVDIVCFPEVFLAPFFPNRLIQDYEKHFLTLPSPVTDPLFAVARENKVALIPLVKDRIIDRQNAYRLVEHFAHREDKATVQELLLR